LSQSEELISYICQDRSALAPEEINENWKERAKRLEEIATELVEVIDREPLESTLRDNALCSYAACVKEQHPLGDYDAGWMSRWALKFPRTRECPDPEAALTIIMALPRSIDVHRALQVRAASYKEYQMIKGEGVYRREDDLNSWFGRALEYAMLNPVPLGFHWWAMANVLGAGCQSRVYMAEGAEEIWPNWYLILGGRKNCGKSAAMKIAMEVIYKVNEKLDLRDYDPLYHHKRIKILAEEATLKALQLDLARMLDTSERDAGRVIPSTGILPLDEMPSYFGKDSYKVTEKFPFFNTCKNTPHYAKATGAEGTITLHDTAISIIACCSPAWLRGTIQLEQLGGGFWDRCMVVYRKPVRLRAKQYPHWKLPPRDPVECSWLAQHIVDILDYPKKIPAFLSPEAKVFMDAVHCRLLAEEHRYEDIHGHVDEIVSASRMTKFINQMAMLITLGEGLADPLEIPLRNVQMATLVIEVEMRSLRTFLAESRKEGIDCEAEIESYIKLECGGCAHLGKIVNAKKALTQFKNVFRAGGSGTIGVKLTLENLIEDSRVVPCTGNTLKLFEDRRRGVRRYRTSGHDEEECDECSRRL